MAIYEILKDDHDNLKNLIEQIEFSKNMDEKHSSFKEFKTELLTHSKVEEKVFYEPLLEKISPQIKEAINEHHVVDMLLEELELLSVMEEDWDAKFNVLKENLYHHIKEEERELFNSSREHMFEDDAKRIGIDFIERKELARRALS